MTPALLHPFAPTSQGQLISIARGAGALVWDADGNEYVDALANLWLCQVGHGRDEIIDAAAEQMRSIAGYNIFAPFTNGRADLLAERLSTLAPMTSSRVFLTNSGSESIDTAIKLARLHHQLLGDADRQVLITRHLGYHGTNIGGTSIQGIEAIRSGWGALLPDVLQIPNDDLEAAEIAFEAVGDRCAAVISEPVQGSGGVNLPPAGYFEGLRDLCDRYGALLIADEVICGFGRTGSWFGSETYGVRPDMVTFAKGVSSGYVPVGGVIIDRRLTDAWENEGLVLRHGYTYSGHPAACAAALANLDIIEREGLCKRAVELGEVISTGLESLVEKGAVASYRGIGALWAADLGFEGSGRCEALLERGVITRTIGSSVVISPPLVISENQIERVFDAIAEVSFKEQAARST